MQWQNGKPLQMLDFDIENRPLSYLGQDFTTAEITGIAWSWVGEDDVECLLLERTGKYVDSRQRRLRPVRALAMFTSVYDRADVVTGHYIRRHDLPMINGALVEAGLPPLKPKYTCDTKEDLVARKGVSAAQESLAAMYGLAEDKLHLTQRDLRDMNRLLPDGMELTRERVVGDVLQHKALRVAMVEHGHLKAGRMWRP
jgi:hypothetical protein